MRPGVSRSVEDAIWAAHQIGGDPQTERTSVQRALQGLQCHRHADEAAWPYGNPPFPASRPTDATNSSRLAELVAWRRMPLVDPDAVANEVSSRRAVVLTLGVVMGAWSRTGDVDAPKGRKTPGAHAVLAVGITTLGGERRTVIKNSWGDKWGVGGYGFISDRYLNYYSKVGHVLEPAA